MAFVIEFTQTAADHVRAMRKLDEQAVLNAIEQQLRHEPATETRNKKRLGPNDVSNWELRVGDFRVFYDLVLEDDQPTMKIKAVGKKEHNKLYVGGKETVL
jgi:mRNA-degrading endonuclease RelE of RelBE toxin-antitoxin system